jgi:hypothetical protein
MAEERGESLSLVIRDMVRAATAARRIDRSVPTPPDAKDFR